MVKIMSGGGYTSNKLVQSKGYKTEPVSKAMNPEAVAQQGLAAQFKKPPLQHGQGYTPKAVGSTGIANSRQGHSGPGPGGGGRMIYKSGSQCPTPEAREMTPGHDILNDYGRDVPGRGRR